MSKKESLQKKFDRLERYAKFYLNMLLAVLSALIWSVYAILEKIVTNNSIIILEALGIIVVIFLVLKIYQIDKEQDELLENLEKEK